METDNPFEKVLDRLREKGWIKGESGNLRTGPNCVVGAGYKIFNHHHYALLEGVLGEHYADRTCGDMAKTPNFNDHPDTTFADVERVLEKAAVKWEEERVLRND